MRLSAAELEAWRLWCREVINGEEIEAEVSPELAVAWLKWRTLMNDREFALLPQNSPEFRRTLAAGLPPVERYQLARIAGLTDSEAFAMPLPTVVNAARRAVARRKAAEPPAPKPRGPKPDPAKEDIERLYRQGNRDYLAIAEALQLGKLDGRYPAKRVERVVNALQKRDRRKRSG